MLRAAVSIADEKGLGSLSMRALGGRLGVEAMSLYNYVANKGDLLNGMLDLVVEEIAVPSEDDDWRSAMVERARSARIAFSRHTWASALLDSRESSGPARLRYFDAMLGCLTRAGFSLEQAARAFSVLDCYIYGFSRQKQNMGPSEAGMVSERAKSMRASIPADSYPHLARMSELAMEKGYDEEADFEFGLGIIVDGLERTLAASRS